MNLWEFINITYGMILCDLGFHELIWITDGSRITVLTEMNEYMPQKEICVRCRKEFEKR